MEVFMSRYDNRNLNRILHELINNIQSDKEHLLLEDYKEVLSKVKAVHVINRLHFDGVTDYIWYIGKKTYVSLIKCHAFKYMSNLRSLRLHYVITQNHILYKLKLEDDYTKYQHYKKQLTINRLPDEIGELKELVTLDLSMTNIDKIPDSVANLTNLEYLFLDNTHIEVIPSWISKLNKLHTINPELFIAVSHKQCFSA